LLEIDLDFQNNNSNINSRPGGINYMDGFKAEPFVFVLVGW